MALVAATLLAAMPLPAQGEQQPPGERELEQARAELLAELAEGGVEVDLEARTVTIPAEVNIPVDPLEYVLIHRRGKSHEALLLTDVKPSLLNSAFLLLGYEPGRNARFEPIDPPPSDEEIMQGAEIAKVVPPEGMPLWMTVRWRPEGADEDREVPVEDLIVDLTTGEPLADNAWIFLGGRMAPLYRGEPPVFVADYEGNLVSVCYLAPENHIATMSHPRARDDENWWRTKLCPPPGTAVELRFCAEKPAAVAAREERLRDGEEDAPGDDPDAAGDPGRR